MAESDSERAGAQVFESEARLRALVENSLEVMSILSLEGQITYTNRAIEALLGYRVEEFVGHDARSLVHPEDAEEFSNTLDWVTRKANRQICAELRFHHQDGSWRNLQFRLANLLADPAVRGLVCNFRDVTASRLALEREQRARSDAEAASSAKDRFLAALSHELRTPLTPVVALLPVLLKEPDLTPELRKDLLMIQRNVLLEARLIDDLLDITRIEQGRLQLQLHKADIHELMQHSVNITKADMEAKGLVLEMDFSAEHSYVKADPARLQQVFWNLVKNAVKFTPKGGAIRIYTQNPSPDLVCLSVTDSGIGIEPENLPRIFEAFSPTLATTSYRFGGLGLGLSISKAIVEQHGGRIWAVSKGAGEGATFFVELGTTQPPAKNETLRIVVPGTITPPSLRILLVEDHENTLEVMARLLRKRGHTVETASTVADAIAKGATQSFDVLVSDLGLPDGSGLDVMRQVRQLQSGIRGIALSGFGMEEDLKKSREAGFSAHLTKPVNLHQLSAALGRVAAPPAAPSKPSQGQVLRPQSLQGSRFPQGTGRQ